MNIIISRYCIIKDRARGPYKENWKRRTSLLNAVQSSSGERTQQNTNTPADQDGSRYLQRPSSHPATLKIRTTAVCSGVIRSCSEVPLPTRTYYLLIKSDEGEAAVRANKKAAAARSSIQHRPKVANRG